MAMSSLGGRDFHSLFYMDIDSPSYVPASQINTFYLFFLISFLAIHSYCPILHRLCQHQNFHYPQNLSFDCPTWWLSPPTFLPYLLTHAHYIFNLLKPSNALPPPLSQSTRSPSSHPSVWSMENMPHQFKHSLKKSWILLLCCIFFTFLGPNPSSGYLR